jgi:hypothetical protein
MKDKVKPPVKDQEVKNHEVKVERVSTTEAPPSKARPLYSPRFMIPLGVILLTGFLVVVIFLQPVSVLKNTSNPQDIEALKGQTAALTTRVNDLETTVKESKTQSVDPNHLKDIEARITALHQQIDVLQNQPKTEITPHDLERSKSFDKEVSRLSETQKILKSVYLFWRLKSQILSGGPYATELSDFKSTAKEFEEIATLEKYADQGLHALKESQNDPQSTPEKTNGSWWERLIAMTGSLIKVEKIDQPESLPSQPMTEQQDVEEALNEIDQALIQQLITLPPSPRSLPGDPL